MAVITELIDVGLQLKRQGNLRGAIEHFRQLHATYPGNARIMFELAACWTAFDVPEQALPLYRDLLKAPKGQGLPPKDMPRLYTRHGAALLTLGESQEALTTIDEGLRLHPSYRPLRVWRIVALSRDDADRQALLEALDLLLESLAPSRWDVFEDEIVAAVNQLRPTPSVAASHESAQSSPVSALPPEAARDLEAPEARLPVETSDASDADDSVAEVDIEVKVKNRPKTTTRKSRRNKRRQPAQLGKKAVRIDISEDATTADAAPDDDDRPAQATSRRIPVDPD